MELLNCPFCGGEAFVNFDELGDTNLAHVMCSECWVAGPERDDGTEQAAWNTRTPDPAQAELLAEAVEALTYVRQLISEGAETGFNCRDGDWAERLFASNAQTSATLARIKESTDE